MQAGQESEAGKHEKDAHCLLDRAEVRGKAPEEAEESADPNGGKKERHAEAQGIGGEQKGALPATILGRWDGEDGGEHRSNAGRPAEGEGKPNRISPDEPRRPRLLPIALLAVEEGQAEEPQKMQAHEDDEDAGELGQERQV